MEDKDCCTYNCEQGKNCPVRATRRVRAGQPAPPILLNPVDTDDPQEELPDWAPGVFVAATIVIVGLFAFGWVALL
jgi:hypothetical protein